MAAWMEGRDGKAAVLEDQPVMSTVVINLTRSFERRRTMARRLDQLGIVHEFFTAIDGRAGEHLQFSNYSEAKCLRAWRRPLTPGEVGVFASHYLLWRRCAERNEPLIIMEDDVELSPSYPDVIQVLPALSDFGYLRLAGIGKSASRAIRYEMPVGRRVVRYTNGPMGAQCYALFPAAARALLAKAESWLLPVDNYLDSFWLHGVGCLGLLPFETSIPEVQSTVREDGRSPSAVMRGRVARPKRLAIRMLDEFQRCRLNLQYDVGLRRV